MVFGHFVLNGDGISVTVQSITRESSARIPFVHRVPLRHTPKESLTPMIVRRRMTGFRAVSCASFAQGNRASISVQTSCYQDLLEGETYIGSWICRGVGSIRPYSRPHLSPEGKSSHHPLLVHLSRQVFYIPSSTSSHPRILCH